MHGEKRGIMQKGEGEKRGIMQEGEGDGREGGRWKGKGRQGEGKYNGEIHPMHTPHNSLYILLTSL